MKVQALIDPGLSILFIMAAILVLAGFINWVGKRSRKGEDIGNLYGDMDRTRWIAVAAIMTALVLIGNYVLVVIPNVELGTVLIFLTGSLFGLKTTLDRRTQNMMQEEYAELLGKRERTGPEEQRFRELQRELEFRVPVPQEIPAERRAQELLHMLLEEQAGSLYPEMQERLLKKAGQLLDEVQARGGKTR